MPLRPVSPRATTRILLAVLIVSSVFLDYWAYNRQYYALPQSYTEILNGTASAPNQYRVLIVRSAAWIQQHAHVGLRHGMALLDLLGAVIALGVLLRLMEKMRVYMEASNLGQWLASAAYLVWTAFALAWLIWYQRPETLPSSAFIACMLAVMAWRPRSAGGYVLSTLATVALVVLQALTRADLAFCLYVGVFIVSLSPLGKRLPAGQIFQTVVAAVSVLLAGGVQWYMMHVVYPGRSYSPGTPVVELILNIKDHLRIVPFVCFLVPVALMVWGARRCWRRIEAEHLAMLAGLVVFLPLWCTVGKIDEVRIAMPLVLALGPMAAAVVLSVATEGEEA